MIGAALLGDSDDEDYTLPHEPPDRMLGLHDHTAGSSSRPPAEPKIAPAQFEIMQSLQSELIHMRKSHEDRFDVVMRKSQKPDEALASLFLGQQTLLEQLREDRTQQDWYAAACAYGTQYLAFVTFSSSYALRPSFAEILR